MPQQQNDQKNTETPTTSSGFSFDIPSHTPLSLDPHITAPAQESANLREHARLLAVVRMVLREELQELRGEIVHSVIKELSKHLRLQGSIKNTS